MRKKSAALLLCVMLLLQMVAIPAQADESVYFVAAGSEMQPLQDQTMPLWSGGYLYIPASIFTGTVRRKLGVSFAYLESENVAILAQDGNHLLKFDLDLNYATDVNDRIYRPGALLRNGTVYVSAYLLAEYFDLDYTVTSVEQGNLVWIRQKDFGLTVQQFVDAASYTMATYYDKYMKDKQELAPVQKPDTGTAIAGKRIYLAMEANEETGRLMDALERNDAQAAFFCAPHFLQEQGGLLRRMIVTGQAVGLLVDASNPEKSVLEQAEEGNLLLEQATCSRTRLVRIENGKDEHIRMLSDAGYRCLQADLNRAGYSLRNSANADSLSQRLSTWRGSAVVWLGNGVSSVGLQAYLKDETATENRFLAWTETA